ncbi:hypothetical protein F0919_18000 [Taibaiella lutea]|uniref:Uncharacterized protein n=1 Tax=Taibaiella lutea TaxID=2608001 RepID=A0A5M6CBZ6_9BACT|nr:hypothetical protein [Taibaiella lutea]KAA5532674.1 hypothetical protein F0919_18000 [Taibaiella lutea]
MVQALIEGRKTQTRRIIKNHAAQNWDKVEMDGIHHAYKEWFNEDDGKMEPAEWLLLNEDGDVEDILGQCPYGKPGDFLWVRESWQINSWDFEDGTCDIKYATGEVLEWNLKDAFDNSAFTAEWLQFQLDAMAEKGIFKIVDKNDNETSEDDEIFYKRTGKAQPFKPSIHMPKEAARIWLKVKNIRVERLMDISEDDAVAEGIQRYLSDIDGRMRYKDYLADTKGYGHPNDDYPTVGLAVTSFCTLWDKINGSDSRYANPWLFVVEFEVLSTTGKPEFLN